MHDWHQKQSSEPNECCACGDEGEQCMDGEAKVPGYLNKQEDSSGGVHSSVDECDDEGTMGREQITEWHQCVEEEYPANGVATHSVMQQIG